MYKKPETKVIKVEQEKILAGSRVCGCEHNKDGLCGETETGYCSGCPSCPDIHPDNSKQHKSTSLWNE